MVTVGGVFVTVTVSCWDLELALLSITAAVMRCTPGVRTTATEPPQPTRPRRADVQLIAPVRFPASRSVALPANVTVVPSGTVVPSAGPVTVSRGAALPIDTPMVALPVVPRLFATRAVI